MKNCPICDLGPVYPLMHSFNDACDNCAARHFAHLQVFYESGKTRSITVAYKAALERRFGADGMAEAHLAAKEWAGKIAAARAARLQTN